MDRRKRRRLLSALQSGILEDIRSISNTAIASFIGDGRDLVRLVVGIDLVQSGSGDPSPDNVRPITGWTECKVTRTGKNLLDPAYRYEDSTANNYHVRYYYHGPSFPYYEKLLLKKGVTYTLSFTGAANAAGLYVYSDSSTRPFIKYSSNFITFTPTDDFYAAFDIYWASGDIPVEDVLCQLEVSSTASSYEAYQGQTYTIDLDGTRYGGTLDVTTGKLTVDRAMMVFDGTQSISIVNWRASSTSVGWVYSYSLTNNKVETVDSNMPNIVCDSLPTITYADAFSMSKDVGITAVASSAGTSAYGFVLRLNDPTLTTASAINTYLSAHPVTAIYELATPIEVQLTPTQIATLSGANNIWADTGDIILLEYMA